jgi:hypothetical protein
MADDDASSCAFQNSHQNGGRVFLIFVADPNRTVVQDLGRCFVIRAIVEALTVPWTARLP